MRSQMHNTGGLAQGMRELRLNPAEWSRLQKTKDAQADAIKKQTRERIMVRVRQLAQAETAQASGQQVPEGELRVNPKDWSRLWKQAEAEEQREREKFDDELESSPMSVEQRTQGPVPQDLRCPSTRQPEVIDLVTEDGSPMDIESSTAAESPMDLASPDNDLEEDGNLIITEVLTAPGTYYCSLCGGTYIDHSAFEQHIKDERYEHGFLDCDFCKEHGILTTFSDNLGLASSVVALQQHIQLYHPESPPEWLRCNQCSGKHGRKFRTFLNLARHQAEKHPEARVHACPECQRLGELRSFPTAQSLRSHFKQIHGFTFGRLPRLEVDEQYSCPVCEKGGEAKRYTKSELLEEHLKVVHQFRVPSEDAIAKIGGE